MRIIFLLTALFCSSPITAQTYQNLPDLADQAFTHLNERRQSVGLPPLARNRLLDQSSMAHVRYLIANNSIKTEGHFESPKRPGFTGITPDSRIRATGYTGILTSENMALVNYPVGNLPTDNLIDAPFHRESEFGHYNEAGVALVASSAPNGSINTQHYIYVINFGKSIRSKAIQPPIVYPVNGQTDVPIDWIANESPNPLPDMAGKTVGYPISIAVTPEVYLVIKSFRLSASDGSEPDTKLFSSNGTIKSSLAHYAFIIPLKPLKSGVRYTCSVSGFINGRSFTKEWQFTTKSHSKLILTSSTQMLDWNREPRVVVKISGGTGNGYIINKISQTFQSTQAINAAPAFYHVEHPSPDVMILTEGESTCAYPLKNCSITVRGSDSSGQEVSLVFGVK